MDISGEESIPDIFEKITKDIRKGKYFTKQMYEKYRAKVSQEVTKAIDGNKKWEKLID